MINRLEWWFLVKCGTVVFHYPLQCEQRSRWWPSIKISGIAYGFVNIHNAAEDTCSPNCFHLNKRRCFRSDDYFSILKNKMQHTWMARNTLCLTSVLSLAFSSEASESPSDKPCRWNCMLLNEELLWIWDSIKAWTRGVKIEESTLRFSAITQV